MKQVEDVITIMRESNYFDAWNNVLLNENAITTWYDIIENIDSLDLYEKLGRRLHEHNVPFVIVSEYIDEFLRYYQKELPRHQIKNKIAQAYLFKKLISDRELLEKEINKKVSSTLESKKELINAHLKWMKNFIDEIIGRPSELELNFTQCFVGQWMTKEKENIDPYLYELHRNLHSMAQSAIRMYKKDDYAYFLLLYIDVLASSYQIRDSIMNIYFSRRLTSIFHDPISGQANYLQLKHDIAKYSDEYFVLMLNIKEFSKINLLYMHDTGDSILKELTNLIASMQDVTKVYRVYGDEIAIVFEKNGKEQILNNITKTLKEHKFTVSGSNPIHLSFYGSVATVSNHALERCEYGLMLSKSKYGEIVDVDTLNDNTLKTYANKITLSQQLRLAFLDNRIFSYYQPILDIKTGKVTKFETLMRVEDLEGNILSPADFIEVLHDMYIYPEVTKTLIKNAFEKFKDTPYEFSINLSFKDVINLDTEAFILAMIKEYPDTAKRCTFELLEHEAFLNSKNVKNFFILLRSYGVKIALDDFGVGYTNFDTIFQFDIDYIKIDGSLTESILTSHKSKVLIESIITLAKQLDVKIVAEFVSSQEIYDAVSALEIDYAQGFHIGLPLQSIKV